MSTISAGTTLGTALVFSGDTSGNLVVKTGASATTAATFDSGGTVTITNATITNATITNLTTAKGAQDFIVQSYGIV